MKSAGVYALIVVFVTVSTARCEAPARPMFGDVGSSAEATAADAVPSAPVPSSPAAPEDERDPLLEWVDGRFEAAGLAPPDVTVVTHESRDGCYGHVAAFVGVEPVPEIHLCFDDDPLLTRQRVTLHEHGHAWTHQHLTDDDREAFLALRGIDHWDEPARWFQQGAEHAAEIIAWGLLEDDIGVKSVAPNDHDSLVAAFRFLTGVDPLCEPTLLRRDERHLGEVVRPQLVGRRL